MWPTKNIGSFAGWAISIYRKVLRIAPLSVMTVVLTTLISQLAKLVAFFLPLKLIILIGSPETPSYFPEILRNQQREHLVIGLGVVTVCIYLLHLLADRIAAKESTRAAERLLGMADKLAMATNQEDVARDSCRRLAETIAAAIFACLGILLIAWLHPSMAVLLVIWCAALPLAAVIAGQLSSIASGWLEDNWQSAVQMANNLGFFAVTALIVAEFAMGIRFGVLAVIIGLLVSRQTLQQVAQAVGNIIVLDSRRPMLNALFFSSHPWSGATRPPRKDAWDHVMGDPRWLLAIMEGAMPAPDSHARIARWHQTGVPDILAFDAVVQTGPEAIHSFVRLFGPSRKVASAHEGALLKAAEETALPAPRLIDVHDVGGFFCHIHEEAGSPVGAGEWSSMQFRLRAELLAFSPPPALIARYGRTHPTLDRRLETIRIDRMIFAAETGEDRDLVRHFENRLGDIGTFVRSMPVAIHNPDLGAETVFCRTDGSLVATNWAHWRPEPVGVGWSSAEKDIPLLAKWLEHASARRKGLGVVTAEDARLAGLLFNLDAAAARQRYRSAIGLLPDVLSAISDARPARRATGS